MTFVRFSSLFCSSACFRNSNRSPGFPEDLLPVTSAWQRVICRPVKSPCGLWVWRGRIMRIDTTGRFMGRPVAVGPMWIQSRDLTGAADHYA
jgi:hypothetical protein